MDCKLIPNMEHLGDMNISNFGIFQLALGKMPVGSKNWVHRIRRSDNNENLKDLIVQILNKIGTLYIHNLII